MANVARLMCDIQTLQLMFLYCVTHILKIKPMIGILLYTVKYTVT